MPTTPGGLPYPSSTDAADVPGDMQALAEAVEAQVAAVKLDVLMLMGA